MALMLAFLAGVALSDALPAEWNTAWALAAAGALALIAWIRAALRRSATPLLLAALLLAGFARDRVADPRDAARDIAADGRGGREQRELIVRVTDDPQPAGDSMRGWTLWQFRAAAEAARAPGGWRRARGTLRARMALPPGEAPPAYGDRWRVRGVLEPEPGRRDYARRFEVRPEGAQRIARGGGFPLVRAAYAWRAACRARLARGISGHDDARAVVEALVLGYRSEVPDDVRDHFLRTGTLHILAISGMHVGVMLMLMLPILRATGWPRPRWAWAIVPLLGMYTLATGAASSAVRAWIMACAYWIAPAVGRRPDPPTALAMAALFIVAASPAQVRDPGFVYSFIAVAGLMVFADPLARTLRRERAPEAWAPEADAATGPPPGRGARWAGRAARVFSGMFAASLVAWLVSAPLSARYGNVISPAAVLGNLPMVPAAFVVLMTGVLSLLAGAVWPWAGEVFNHANVVFSEALLWTVRALAAVPGSHAYVRTPSWGWIAAAYGAMAGLFLLRGAPRRTLVGALAAVATAAAVNHATDSRATVVFPGDGLAPTVWINVPGPADVLMDPGPTYRANRLIRYLRSQGVDRLAAIILTQADADHAGAARRVAAAIPTAEAWCVPDTGRSPVYRGTLAEWVDRGSPVVIPRRAGDSGVLPGGVEWEVLRPAEGERYARASDNAAVWRFGRGAEAVLLTGACGAPARAALRTAPPDPGATLWVMDRSAEGEDADLWAAIRARTLLLRPEPGAWRVRADPSFRRAAPPGARIVEIPMDTGATWDLPP